MAKPKNPRLGPRKPIKSTPSGPQEIIHQNEYQISFDPLAFDVFIKGQGIWVTHYMAIPDPRGMGSRGDSHDVLALRPKDSDGFIYKEVGDLQVLFSANSKYVEQRDLGELAFATAYMTMPRFYPDTPLNREKKLVGKQVLLSTWDKFFLKEIEIKVVETQFIEANRGGKDRLSYPAVNVMVLVDSNGVYYEHERDYKLTEDGEIHWLGQRRPGWNAVTGRGTVYSVRYEYTPFFIVSRLMHEIRVAQITDQTTFERSLQRMPFQVQVVRETVFRNNDVPTDPARTNPRTIDAPAVGGGLGPINPPVGGKLGPPKYPPYNE
jgi:hypothetical protein